MVLWQAPPHFTATADTTAICNKSFTNHSTVRIQPPTVASNKLKAALYELSNASFTAYVSSLKRDDNSIWKPLKSRKKTTNTAPPIHKNTTSPGPWAKSDSEKVVLFANHLAEVFTPHDNTMDPEVEGELATHTQHSEKLQDFTLSELK